MSITRFGIREVVVSSVLLGGISVSLFFLAVRYDIFWLLPVAALPLIVFGWVLWFFRDPSRVVPQSENIIVCPADGTVTHLDIAEEPDYIGGEALRCSIFLSIFDPHINRAPAVGKIEFLQYRPGAFYDARSEDSLVKNENQDVGIKPSETGFPSKILVRQSSGAIARRIVCPVEIGAELYRGEKYGMIKFGSRTTLFISPDAPIEWMVKVGDSVKAGETVIARIVTGDA